MATIIRLDQIVRDNSTQARHYGLNGSVVYDYEELMKAGTVFPPIIVYHDGSGKEFWLADGFHRVAAARQAGATEIAAEVRAGTQRDAILYANGEANRDHGLQLTRDDKRRRVENMLKDDEWSQWSNRQIAKHCGVSHEFVSIMRERLKPVVPDERANEEYRKHQARHWGVSNGTEFWNLVIGLRLDKQTILEQLQPGAKALTDLPNEGGSKDVIWQRLFELAKERIAAIHPVDSVIVHLASKRCWKVTGHNAGSYGVVIFAKDLKHPDEREEHIQISGIAAATPYNIEMYLKPELPELKVGDRVVTRTGHEGTVASISGAAINVETVNGTHRHKRETLTLVNGNVATEQPQTDTSENPYTEDDRVSFMDRPGTIRYIKDEQCGVYFDESKTTHYYHWSRLVRLEDAPESGNVATSDDDKLTLMETVYTYLSGNLGIGQVSPLDFDELIEWLTEQRNELDAEQTYSEMIAKNEVY